MQLTGGTNDIGKPESQRAPLKLQVYGLLVPEGMTVAVEEEVGKGAEQDHGEWSGGYVAVELGGAGEEDGRVTACEQTACHVWPHPERTTGQSGPS